MQCKVFKSSLVTYLLYPHLLLREMLRPCTAVAPALQQSRSYVPPDPQTRCRGSSGQMGRLTAGRTPVLCSCYTWGQWQERAIGLRTKPWRNLTQVVDSYLFPPNRNILTVSVNCRVVHLIENASVIIYPLQKWMCCKTARLLCCRPTDSNFRQAAVSQDDRNSVPNAMSCL